MDKNLTAISLYTGIGGLDMGFEAAGFRTTVAVEMDPVCCRSVRANRPWPVIEGDINAISSQEILATAGLAPGHADVLIGGPPCQPFSKSGYWATGDARRLRDPRADTLTAYLRVLRDTRPRAFLLENVKGLGYKGKDEGLRHILQGIDQVNREAGTDYSYDVRVLNAADYGVPQLRERVFIVGARDGTLFLFPEPTHGPARPEPHRTAWDAIGDLPPSPREPGLEVNGKWGGLLPTIPEGDNYLWHTERGGGYPLFGWRRRYWTFLLKLAKNLPAWTIQAQPGTATGPFHWRSRRLSSLELSRLQTFPDGLSFAGCSRQDIQRMLGNAVPSLLAEVLAREIRAQLLGAEAPGEPLRLLPPARDGVPSPEPVAPLPDRYLKYVGEHSAHPGEGKGPARSAA
jgi:DNA (cytosine-5)-methyltransferase 1